MLATAALFGACLIAAPTGANGCVHGMTASLGCDGPRCTGETIDCRFAATHSDTCGDSTQIAQAWAIVHAAAGDVRLPSIGNLEIVDVSGNTTAVIGGFLPVIIGPAGSTRNGLPGMPSAGKVTFGIDEYTFEVEDAGDVEVVAWLRYQDFCDAPDTPPDCSSEGVDFFVSNPVTVEMSCDGDVNADCDVGFADVLAILGAWGNGGGPEDADGDGRVDFADILYVLGRWGACNP